ncbi:hypothetical protein phiK7A1_158 [Pseudomonas phage phiK7A1]|uniref:Uncharacterized protein n=1 Tax=Pseudomonas phage phiK7A1 TaxID=2759194 RepID=A0A7H0XG06_9CAUD|nr:hypothetical protein phiK7A1_158 [Pseudomonas phage phiK7A1]
MALSLRYNREACDANSGSPRVVRVVLCDNHGYLTFAGDCGCSIQHDYERFAIVGTTYGWLHNTAGDIRFFKSESGARHALKVYLGDVQPVPVVKPLECSHADTCLPDYWSGHHLAHIQVPVHKGMHLKELKEALHSELSQGAVMGSDDRTRDDSGPVGDVWYKKAHAAVNRIKPMVKGKRRLFESLQEHSDDDYTVYAYFVFTEKE